jgi:hypothetical protein
MPQYSDFVTAFPEFAAIDSAAGGRLFALGVKLLNAGVLGEFYTDLLFLWVAHYLALRFNVGGTADDLGMNDQSQVGITNSMSASTGSLSVSNSHNAMVTGDNAFEADMSRTNYGLEFLSLLSAVVPAGKVVHSPMAVGEWR